MKNPFIIYTVRLIVNCFVTLFFFVGTQLGLGCGGSIISGSNSNNHNNVTVSKCEGHPNGTKACEQVVEGLITTLRNGNEIGNYCGNLYNGLAIKFESLGNPARTTKSILGDFISINMPYANVMTSGTQNDRFVLAGYFCHELIHYYARPDQLGTSWGELEAYLTQYEVLREFGFNHLDVLDINVCGVVAAGMIWDYNYVARREPNLWTDDGLKIIGPAVSGGNLPLYNGTKPATPARYDSRNPPGRYTYRSSNPSDDTGNPREQYGRTYLLLNGNRHGTADAENYATTTWDKYHWTIGMSADDAGMGKLSDRTVVAVDPASYADSLTDFFKQYYPGVKYIDYAQLSTSQPTTLGSGTPSGVRENYGRTYVLLRAENFDSSWAKAVVRATWDNGDKFTVGASADDAGIGPLSNKRVVVVNPEVWYDAANTRTIFQFYSQYYPGVVVQTISASTPADLANQIKLVGSTW